MPKDYFQRIILLIQTSAVVIYRKARVIDTFMMAYVYIYRKKTHDFIHGSSHTRRLKFKERKKNILTVSSKMKKIRVNSGEAEHQKYLREKNKESCNARTGIRPACTSKTEQISKTLARWTSFVALFNRGPYRKWSKHKLSENKTSDDRPHIYTDHGVAGSPLLFFFIS